MHAIYAPDHTRQTMLSIMYLVDLLKVVPCGRSKITRTVHINYTFIKKDRHKKKNYRNCKHRQKK
ncbi:hypothetical protein Hanom_Chr06g00482821 [Helianthus anomalus]